MNDKLKKKLKPSEIKLYEAIEKSNEFIHRPIDIAKMLGLSRSCIDKATIRLRSIKLIDVQRVDVPPDGYKTSKYYKYTIIKKATAKNKLRNLLLRIAKRLED
jgi:predicted transcriptional regulator